MWNKHSTWTYETRLIIYQKYFRPCYFNYVNWLKRDVMLILLLVITAYLLPTSKYPQHDPVLIHLTFLQCIERSLGKISACIVRSAQHVRMVACSPL